MLSDWYLPLEINPTFGSGGGINGGRGGGRIFLNSDATVVLKYYGRLSAKGSKSPNAGAGAGSGGSVLIMAKSITHTGGWIDVSGGDADTLNGAGGGGRISVIVSYILTFLFP